MKTVGIYMITNKVNGKVYIGQSVCVEKRRVYHLARLKRGSHQNLHMQASFNKYGEENFEFKVLFSTRKGGLDMMERMWIKHYKSNDKRFGFNKDGGGSKNKELSAETKKLLSDANAGKTIPDHVREKISKTMKGYIRSETHRLNLSRSLKGRRPSDKCIAASVDKRKGSKLNDEARKRKSESWHRSPKSVEHLANLNKKNAVSHEEWLRRASGPKPCSVTDNLRYQKWLRARKKLGMTIGK